MEEIKTKTTDLRRLQGRLGSIFLELTRFSFPCQSPTTSWQPAVNAFLCDDGISVCFELAGVDKESIDLRVESRALHVRGRRPAPEPCPPKSQKRILAMEIDCGRFERLIELPLPIDTARVTAEQQNGMLWVYLPLREET